MPFQKGAGFSRLPALGPGLPAPHPKVHVASCGQKLGFALPGGLHHSHPCFGWNCRKKTPLLCSHLTSCKWHQAEGKTWHWEEWWGWWVLSLLSRVPRTREAGRGAQGERAGPILSPRAAQSPGAAVGSGSAAACPARGAKTSDGAAVLAKPPSTSAHHPGLSPRVPHPLHSTIL